MKTLRKKVAVIKRAIYFTTLWEPSAGDLPPNDVIASELKKFTAEDLRQKLFEPILPQGSFSPKIND